MKHWKLWNNGPVKSIEDLTGSSFKPHFKLRDPFPGDYGLYTPECFKETKNGLILNAIQLPQPEVPAQWIIDEQKKWNVAVHNFSHHTGGVDSIERYRPPFHAQVISRNLFNRNFLESVWFLNDSGHLPTRELDMFESGRGDIRRRLWFAYHHGGVAYSNRKSTITELFFAPFGKTQKDLYVYRDHVEWYLNKKLIRRVDGDFDYEYNLIATIIVNEGGTGDVEWEIDKLMVEQLKE